MPDHCHFGAGLDLGAVAAGLVSPADRALADLAEVAAVVGLHAAHAAAVAVDVFRQDECVVEFSPFLRDLLAQGLVVVLTGYVGFAFLAVEPTVGDQLSYVCLSIR